MAFSEGPEASIWRDRIESDPVFCCPVDYGAGQALEGFWREVFRSARPGSRVLEIGCGSGQVSLWAAEAKPGLKILATDLHNRCADALRHPDIRFQGHVRAEQLPFPPGAFELVVSNFAFEYADLPPACRELGRVLTPGGGAVLVMHRVDSDISVSSRLMIEIDRRLRETGIPESVRRAAGLGRHHLSRRKLLKQALSRRADIPAAVFNFSGAEYFVMAERLLRGEAVDAAELDQVDQGFAMRLRMAREQARVALDTARLRTLLAAFSAAGLRTDASDLSCTYPDGRVDQVGWIALLTKAAPIRPA